MCAFGNQVEIDASSAKFGKRSASMLPSGRSRSSPGNSSNTTNTTGGRGSADLRLVLVDRGAQQPGETTSAAASSTASQQRHPAAAGHLEHLDCVPALAQRMPREP